MTTPPAGDAPTQVGRFEVRERLRDGTPTVYRAFDPQFDREISLKLYPCPPKDARLLVDQLIRQHRAALDLRHPAILPVYEVGTADGWCYVAGAFVEGPRLSEALSDGPFGLRRAVVVAQALADGLGHAHERGFVHGGVCPSGVVLPEDGGAAWLDFGTETDAPPRDPAYAAPERLGDPPGPADTASDQYGVGVLLYAMLVGDQPFTGNHESIVSQVLTAEHAPSPRRERPEVPRALDAVCRRALAPNPANRYRTCGELADDLRRWLEGGSVAAYRPGPLGRLRRSRAAVAVALLFLLGLAGVGGLAYLQTQRQRAAEQARAQAEAARRNAEQDRTAFAARQAAAANARTVAETQRDQAQVHSAGLEAKLKSEKDKAEDARKEVTRDRDRLEAVVYARLVPDSHRAWRDHDPARARTLLDAGRPAEKRPDLRGWEWFFLQRLYRPPQTFTYKPDESGLAGTEPWAADGTDLRRYVCAFSPDGTHLAISLFDDRVAVWSTLLGGTALMIEGHQGAVCDIAYSPDGKLIATAGTDKQVHLWDAATGDAVRRLRGHADAVMAVAFSPDSQSVATAGTDRTVIVWETSGKKRHTLKGHEAAVLAVALCPDGQVLATADAAGSLRLWELKTGGCTATVSAHAGTVYGLAFSPDGQRLATAGEDRLVKLWDAHTGQEQRVFSGPTRGLRSVAFRPDGARLAAAGDDMTVSVWDLGTSRLAAFPTGHTAPIQRVVYRSDGKQLATTSADGTLKLWDPDRPTGLDDPGFRGHADAVNAVAISPDGRRLATAGQDKSVRLWDARTGELTRTLTGHTGPVRAAAFGQDGRTLVTAGDDKSARLWDVASGQVQRTVAGHTDAILGVALSPDGKTLATASKDGTARLRETATGQALLTLRGHSAAVVGVQFSPDGKRVLTSGGDGSARVWDTSDGREVASVNDQVAPGRLVVPVGALRRDSASLPGAYPARAAYGPDGKRVAFTGRGGSLLLYRTAAGWPDKVAEGHDGLIRCLAYSPDGRRIATGDGMGVIKVWDVRTGLEVLSLPAHDGAVNGVAFSPDGQFLYTASADSIVKVWDGTPLEGRPKKENQPKDDDEP